MQPNPNAVVRRATVSDVGVIGKLLYDFNTEYNDPTPRPAALAKRMGKLMEGGDTVVLLVGDEPKGVAVLRFRPAIWDEAQECYLAELYIVPDQRGKGLGRKLMEAVIETARKQGATYMDLGTSEDDVAARKLYESLGFNNTEGKPNGPVNYYYEREL